MFDLDDLARWDDALARLDATRHRPDPAAAQQGTRYVQPARKSFEPQEAYA